MGAHHIGGEYGTGETNRRLVRLFCICLGTLFFAYFILTFRIWLERGTFGALDLFLISVRLLLSGMVLLVVVDPPWLARRLDRQIDLMGSLFEQAFANSSTKEKIRLIVLVTMVSLLLELVMIRWLASVFPVFSFFKNFTLLACFLGLGAGYAVADKQPCAPALVLPMLALFVGVITLLRYDVGAANGFFVASPMHEQTAVGGIWDGLGLSFLLKEGAPVYVLLAMSFVLCACICYPVGQLCGRLLQSTDALKAYSLNLVGSILGVVALCVMSLFWLPPAVWFTVTGGILAGLRAVERYALAGRGRQLLRAARSPVVAGPAGNPADLFSVSVAGAHVQIGRADEISCREAPTIKRCSTWRKAIAEMRSEEIRYVRAYYEFPFNFKKKPERVAIVGAGSGNDVAAALRMGASHVDAIEIDPAIAYLGKHNHPENPYDDPRVTLRINDARNFFRTADQQYDLIIYGVLDSHTALSHASNLRVDSYVYTREGIAEAFKLLKPDGIMSVAFALPTESLGFKLSHILQELPGAGKPLAVRVRYNSATTTAFIAQKGRDVADARRQRFRRHRIH